MSKIVPEALPADVTVDQAVADRIAALIHRHPHRECGAYLIGVISRDEVTGTPMAHVTDLYEEDRVGTGSSFTFSPDYALHACLYVKKHCPGRHVIGNIHSHADHDAYWSSVDDDMMLQARDNSLYLVVSPRCGRWKARFKDDQFRFYDCRVTLADPAGCEQLFSRPLTLQEDRLNGFPRSVFRVCPTYTEIQQAELDKRFLHAVSALQPKKVLIVGAGTIGNRLVQQLTSNGVGHLTVVDMDTLEYWNLPRSGMLDSRSLRLPKAQELARAAARQACFPLEATAITADVCTLGWGFLRDFDLVLSPVDSAPVRQYIDRGCRLYHIPHITCGTGVLKDGFTGNVLFFPADSAVDLSYVWGDGYKTDLHRRRSCSDLPPETQPQVMSFSDQIAGLATGLAMQCLLGEQSDAVTAWKYVLNAVGGDLERDRNALRTYKYGRLPTQTPNDLYDLWDRSAPLPQLTFDRRRPKRELWQQLRQLFGEEIFSYALDLEWSLLLPVAYTSVSALPRLEITREAGPDPALFRLPTCHVYAVEGQQGRYLLELTFCEPSDERS